MKEFLVLLGLILAMSLMIIIKVVLLIISAIFLIMQEWGIGFSMLLAFVFLSVANYGIFRGLDNFLGIRIK